VWPRGWVAPTPRSRCPSVPRLAAQGVARGSFLFLDRPAGWGTWGTRRTRACHSPHVPPHQPAETPNRMQNGFASQRKREKSELWTGWHGNALVSEAEVLLALMQQFLHCNPIIGPLGEAPGWALNSARVGSWHERFHADSGSAACFQSRRLALYTLEIPNNFQEAAHHELLPLLVLGRVQQLRLGG
jgi:hypothetical protein